MIFEAVTLRVVRSVYFKDDASWNFPQNEYPYNTLYCVIGGDGLVSSNGETLHLRPMHAYLIPPNTQFACKCESRIEKLYIEFSAELLPGLDLFSGRERICEIPLPPLLFPPYILPPSSEDEAHIFAVQVYESLSQQMAFRGTLLQILSGFAGDAQNVLAPELYQFKAIMDDINGALSASLRIAEIARRHGWHPATLSRAFHKQFGRSLKQYIEELLTTRLKQELLTSNKTIREIAFAYGFSDAYYLSAFFKHREGIAPTLYRRYNKRS